MPSRVTEDYHFEDVFIRFSVLDFSLEEVLTPKRLLRLKSCRSLALGRPFCRRMMLSAASISLIAYQETSLPYHVR